MNNQPAFPTGIFTDEKGVIIGGSNGMTLRDYFAAKAMQGMNTRDAYDAASTEQRAKLAYIEADAMLKAREE